MLFRSDDLGASPIAQGDDEGEAVVLGQGGPGLGQLLLDEFGESPDLPDRLEDARTENNRGRVVLMDAPPPQEDVRPFVRIARHLHALGLSAPRVLAEDVANGLLLLDDLGDDTYQQARQLDDYARCVRDNVPTSVPGDTSTASVLRLCVSTRSDNFTEAR